jgi:DnaJ-like protein C11, C-terminal
LSSLVFSGLPFSSLPLSWPAFFQDATEIFTNASAAYEVLSDPVSRAVYDMVIGVRPQTEQEMRKFNRMKREEAKRQRALMDTTVNNIIQRERARNGLIIVEALYGDLTSFTKLGGKINVTVPLQCQVENSVLIVPGGASKAWLDGFYDPNEAGDNNELYVRYHFLDRLHECQVGDSDELIIPQEEHLVEEDVVNMNEESSGLHMASASAAGMSQTRTFRQTIEQQRQLKKTKRRRRFMLFSALAAVVGFFVVRSYTTEKPADGQPAQKRFMGIF